MAVTDLATKEPEGLRLFAVAMIRNEGDIILPFLRHSAELFDKILVADVQSTDGTEAVLRSFSDPRLQVQVYNLDRREYQSAVMDCLSREAFRQGADWVFFLDADEFIDVANRRELEKHLRDSGSDVLLAPWINLVPSRYGSYASFDVTQDFHWCGRTSKTAKLALSSLFVAKNPDYLVGKGSHTVLSSAGANPVPGGAALPLLHLPVRSRDRFKVKISDIARLMKATHNRLQCDGVHIDVPDELSAGGNLDPAELNYLAARYGEAMGEERTLSPTELGWPVRRLPAHASAIPGPDASAVQLASVSETLSADSRLAWDQTEFVANTPVRAVIDGDRIRIVPQAITGDGRRRPGRFAALESRSISERSPEDLLADVISASTSRVRALVVSAWSELIPVLNALFVLLRPRRFVELGTHNGMSFFAACQIKERLELETECVAIDSWVGDEHAGFHSNEVLDDFRAYLCENYPKQEYIQAYFAAALGSFEDGSIDLLHIDGLHTYEAVRNDFETWLPKMSDVGVVVFHDTNVLERNFGVWRLWNELQARYPAHNFAHQHGLGIVYVGRMPHPFADLLRSLSTNRRYATVAQAYFEAIGSLVIESRAAEEKATRLSKMLAETERQFPAPISGAATASGKSAGVYGDGWIASQATFFAQHRSRCDRVILRGYIPEISDPVSTNVSVSFDGRSTKTATFEQGSFEMELPVETNEGVTRVDIVTAKTPDKKESNDPRDLAFVLTEVHFVDASLVEIAVAKAAAAEAAAAEIEQRAAAENARLRGELDGLLASEQYRLGARIMRIYNRLLGRH